MLRRASGARRHRAGRGFDSSLFLLVGFGLVIVALVVFGKKISYDVHPTTASADAELTVQHPRTAKVRPQKVAPAPALIHKIERTCVPRVGEADLTVLSFNIKSGHVGGAGPLDRLAASIQAWDPDVVLLQEVDRFRHTSGLVDQPSWFANRLGISWTFGANVLRGGSSQYGTAILSRYPITSSENTHLPNRPGMQQRGLLHAVLDVDGIPVSIYDTHLQNRSEPMRMEQIRAINAILAADELPKVMGGDFNAQPRSPVMVTARQQMADTWTDVGIGSGFTHPSSHLRGRIDYLLHADGIEPVTAAVMPATGSDHRAVKATYHVTGDLGQVCLPVVQ